MSYLRRPKVLFKSFTVQLIKFRFSKNPQGLYTRTFVFLYRLTIIIFIDTGTY